MHHPIYAGAYRWGYRKIDPRTQQPGRPNTGKTVNPPESCEVLIKDRFPAYISWERFASMQQRLSNNRSIAQAQGAPRGGPSLLGGLLRCGRCGRRLAPAYSGKANHLRYTCMRATIDYGAPVCLSLSGALLDNCVAAQRMAVLQPASLELSIAAEQALRAERTQLEMPWQQRIERAHYGAERAARQYSAVEPENRLVARELERQWEEALRHEQQEQEAYARFCREQPAELTSHERDAIRRLAHDMPGLWASSETTAQDRQEIVRVLLEQVPVDGQGDSEQVDVTLHWAGGVQSQRRVIRPVARYEQLSTYPRLLARIDTLRHDGMSFEQIAEHLNGEGLYPPKRTDQFNGGMIARLLSRRGLHGPRPRAMVETGVLEVREYWLSDLARELHLPRITLYKWQRVGWVPSRKVAEALGRLALWADDEELERLRQLRLSKRQWPNPRYPATLITPKPREKDAHRCVACKLLAGGMSPRRSLVGVCPRYKSACCAGLMPRKDAPLGSSQVATNTSCRPSPMPKAISATACVVSKRTAWWQSVARQGAKQNMSGLPRKGARRPLNLQEVMIKEYYRVKQCVERSVFGLYPLHWRG